MTSRFLLLLLGFFPFTVMPCLASDAHATGIKAPPLDLQQILQAPAGTRPTWDTLHGKVVVLEFWATWCHSCVKMIPHLNELADSLKEKPVQFISVTDEKPETVTPFLLKSPIHGWIGLNPTGSMFSSYAIDQGRPMTIVVRPDGTIDARIRPWVPSLTRQSLINLAVGKPSGLQNVTEVFAGSVRDENDKPLSGVSVWVTNSIGDDGWRELGLTITDEEGHFKIISDDPISYIEEFPVRLTLKRSKDSPATQPSNPLPPKNPDGIVEDLRLFSPEAKANLSLTLHTHPTTRWSQP